jgi:hypothetical protein
MKRFRILSEPATETKMDNPQVLDHKYSSSPVDDHDLSHISSPIQASIATYNNSNNPKLINYTNASQSSILPTTCDAASLPALTSDFNPNRILNSQPKHNFVSPCSRWFGTQPSGVVQTDYPGWFYHLPSYLIEQQGGGKVT